MDSNNTPVSRRLQKPTPPPSQIIREGQKPTHPIVWARYGSMSKKVLKTTIHDMVTSKDLSKKELMMIIELIESI